MATVGNKFTDIKDVLSQEVQGKLVPFVDLMAALSPLVADSYVEEANDGRNMTTVLRNSLPEAVWRKFYGGAPPSKSTFAKVSDACGMLSAAWVADASLIKMAGNPAQARMNESNAHIEAITQTLETGLFYGATKEVPEQITGLAPRFGMLGDDPWGKQIIDAGGTGNDNTSVWFITFGPRQVKLFYPKGSQAGLRHTPGPETIETLSDGSQMPAYKDYFQWDVGMTVADPRYVVRIANIDANAVADGTVDVFKLMRQAYWRHHGIKRSMVGNNEQNVNIGRTFIYCNADFAEALDAASTNGGNSDNFRRMLTAVELQGQMVDAYRKIPVRISDALLNTEARVTAAA
jgi:hypothetical protein